jgi:hypothetical protein
MVLWDDVAWVRCVHVAQRRLAGCAVTMGMPHPGGLFAVECCR